MTPLWVKCIQLSESSSGGDHRQRDSSVSSLRSHGTSSSKADLCSWETHSPTPTRSLPGYLVSKYGVQAPATNQEVYLLVGTPHWAILPWARYCRIDPLGLNQNARWIDLLLVTGLTGQLRKGQFSSHWSTDQCTLNTHRSYRDPVKRVPVRPGIPGTPGQIRCNRSHGSTGHTTHTGRFFLGHAIVE